MIRLRVREAREERGLTQLQLAKLAKLGQDAISHIERGQHKGIEYATWERIARALEVDPRDLVEYRPGARQR